MNKKKLTAFVTAAIVIASCIITPVSASAAEQTMITGEFLTDYELNFTNDDPSDDWKDAFRYDCATGNLYVTGMNDGYGGNTQGPCVNLDGLAEAIGNAVINNLFFDLEITILPENLYRNISTDTHIYCYSHLFGGDSVEQRNANMQILSDLGYSYTLLDTEQNGNVFSGYCGEDFTNIQWTYDADTRVMTFNGTGRMKSYYDGDPRLWLCGNVDYAAVHVIVEEGITDIGDNGLYFFFGMKSRYDEGDSLTLTLPSSLCAGNLYIVADNVAFDVPSDSWAENNLPLDKKPLVTSGSIGDRLSWAYDTETNCIVISGNGILTAKLLSDSSDLRTALHQTNSNLIFSPEVNLPEEKVAFQELSVLLSLLLERSLIVNYEGGTQAAEMIAAYEDDSIPKVSFVLMHDGKPVNIALCGDLNLDGFVDVRDAVLLNKVVNGSVVLSEAQVKAADCNGDGVISPEDSLTLLQFLLHLVDSIG